MLVVKRPFRNFGKTMTVGTVISDPTAIKHFSARFAEGKIIEVTEQTLDSAVKYFKEKHNVDIMPTEDSNKEAKKPEVSKPETKVKTTTATKTVAAKATK